MKRIIFAVITFIQYSDATPVSLFGPMHAAPPINQGVAAKVFLGKRQECPFGVRCGGGCTIQGPCCDNVSGSM